MVLFFDVSVLCSGQCLFKMSVITVELISKAVSCGSWFQEKFRMLVLVLQNSKVFQAVEVIR